MTQLNAKIILATVERAGFLAYLSKAESPPAQSLMERSVSHKRTEMVAMFGCVPDRRII